MVSRGGCLSTILSRILNICHFSLEINHRSQFHNLARWRQGGSVWGLLFSLDWSCLWTLRWFWVTLMEILEWKKTRQWWGPKLVRLWHMISYLYVLLYKEPSAGPFGPCLLSEDLWAVLQSTDTPHYSQWQASVWDSSYVNKCPLRFSAAFIFAWTIHQSCGQHKG